MKTQLTKLLATTICVLSLILFNGCGGSSGSSGDNTPESGGDNTAESGGNTDSVLTIEARHISHEDTRPTLTAVAAGIDPYTTLIDDSFYCYNWDDSDFSSADMMIVVSGNSYSTGMGSGAIQAFGEDDDYDIEFRGGPLDGEAVQVHFDTHGQYFDISPDGRSASCYQNGASQVRAQLKLERAAVNFGDYTCRDIDTGKDVALVISENGGYSLGNTQGRWQATISIEEFETTVSFTGGALGGAELSYYEKDDSGISEFGYVTTEADGLFDNGTSQGPSKLNCWHVGVPVADPVYGSQDTPQPTPPAVSLSGRYVRPVYFSGVMDLYHIADHFWFDANGYAYRGATPFTGLDCNRTQPNGLPFCDTYQFDGTTLTFFSPLGDEVESYSVVMENGQLAEIGGESAVPARLARAADLTGVWSNYEWWNYGCYDIGYCNNGYEDRVFAFNNAARFLYTIEGISTLGVGAWDGDGSAYTWGGGVPSMAGQVNISGTTMTLVFDSGVRARRFILVMDDGHLAIDGLVFTFEVP
ncbi:MAG: hypothetical protein P8163_10760 [Candidatus Thiodiazotropha sp.]